MNRAVLLAAGSGNRTGQDIPKQFLHIEDKPVIVYTMETFEHHPEIDEIYVVCLEGWHDVVRAYAKQFNITKMKDVIPGGHTSQESIRNAVDALKGIAAEDDIILLHDAVRPMVEPETISDCIRVCAAHGSALAAVPFTEQLCVVMEGDKTLDSIDRDTVKCVQTPQVYAYHKLVWAYEKVFREGICLDKSSVNPVMSALGKSSILPKDHSVTSRLPRRRIFSCLKRCSAADRPAG
ncbi:MAG: 2-C-methyl-D-erythritol 4-phosphate cytidylyltransferase [Christensenellales bacterium]